MDSHDAASVAALAIIVVPLVIAMGASMRPERRRPPAAAKPHEPALQDDVASE